jgi:hypothetical protein
MKTIWLADKGGIFSTLTESSQGEWPIRRWHRLPRLTAQPRGQPATKNRCKPSFSAPINNPRCL